MSFKNFEIEKKHVFIALVLGVLSGIFQFECNAWKAEKARTHEEAERLKRFEAQAEDAAISAAASAEAAAQKAAKKGQGAGEEKDPTDGAKAE